MPLKKIADIDLQGDPHSLARDEQSGGFTLTKPGGEDPYGVPFHVIADLSGISAGDLISALGESMMERSRLEAEVAAEKAKVSSAARVGSGT